MHKIIKAFAMVVILTTLPVSASQNSQDQRRNGSQAANAQQGRDAVQSRLDAQRQQQIENRKKANLLGNSVILPQEDETTKALEDGGIVFGARLFKGNFANQQFIGFNPDYEVSAGDQVTVQLWGGFETQLALTVDAQGNIFLPKVGPIQLRGVKNKNLNAHVIDAVAKTFKSNVGVYASLMGAEPVKVFVTGFVNKPGLYAGHSSDSILRFIDLAGGIDTKRGSFINMDVIRNGKPIHTANLYDFLINGTLPNFQIFDGDTILLKPVGPQISVEGLAQNPRIFEFDKTEVLITEVLDLARPTSKATHVRVNRNNLAKEEVEYYALADVEGMMVSRGDVIEVTSDKLPGTIAVRVEGEHLSSQEHILPYGSSLGQLMDSIKMSNNSIPGAIQLYRESNKLRQKEMLNSQLRALESSVLTARSMTAEEAVLRSKEAEMILQWVERAKDIEPKGQVVLGNDVDLDKILLEADDLIVIPTRSNLIHVHGDVMFPTSMVFDKDSTAKDYINLAGGFVQGTGSSTVLLLHQNGKFEKISRIGSRRNSISPGDEILILPKVETKYLQAGKDIMQVLYQIAISAGVLLRL